MISSKQFIETAKKPVTDKWGYIWGTAGEVWTEAKQKAATRDTTIQYGGKWIGKHVADCSGYIKWCLVQNGSTCPHGSNSIWNGSLSSNGKIDDINKVPVGALVFKYGGDNATGDKKGYYHVGIYAGDGYIYQARSTYYGVQKTKYEKTWTHYGLLKMVDYSGNAVNVQPQKTGEAIPVGDYIVSAPSGKTVRLRKGPSKYSNNIIDEIPIGSKIVVTESGDNGWAKVKYTVEGYMATEFLKKG